MITLRRPEWVSYLLDLWDHATAALRARRDWRRAEKDYRALCDEGRAPIISVNIRLDTDRGDDWTSLDVRGITGIQTTVPLTRGGERYITGTVDDIRATCVRQVLHAQRKARGEGQ